MSITGIGKFPLSSSWVKSKNLSTGIFWGNKNTTDKIALNNFFFGSYITKRWDGSSWISANVKRWNGSIWVSANLKTWNGTDWIVAQTV